MLAFQSFFVYKFIALAISISVHEALHAYTAYRMGDPTPQREGRITLNPLKHLSLIGTLMILFAPIGWGKPVMYNPYNFHNYKWGTILTALAGPVGNFILAFLIAIPLKHVDFFNYPMLYQFLHFLFSLNIILMVFNLLPIPPLDGSKVILAIIPDKYHFSYERWMAENGLKIFVVLFIADYMLAKFTGYSVLFNLLMMLAYPVIALINLGV